MYYHLPECKRLPLFPSWQEKFSFAVHKLILGGGWYWKSNGRLIVSNNAGCFSRQFTKCSKYDSQSLCVLVLTDHASLSVCRSLWREWYSHSCSSMVHGRTPCNMKHGAHDVFVVSFTSTWVLFKVWRRLHTQFHNQDLLHEISALGIGQH
jgi:hypothetical protein